MATALGAEERITTLDRGAMALANLAAWWGFVVLPLYLVAFGLILPYRLGLRPGPAVATSLPLAVPLIGLGLALPSLLLARNGTRGLGPAAPIAAVLNGVPALLAIALWFLG